jgi:primosomal protein N''
LFSHKMVATIPKITVELSGEAIREWSSSPIPEHQAFDNKNRKSSKATLLCIRQPYNTALPMS